MARKCGVMLANGEFIMFLDADDFLENNACQIAYSVAKIGIDVVSFNTNIISPKFSDIKVEKALSKWLNLGMPARYEQFEIMQVVYKLGKLSSYLNSKIYSTDLLKKVLH